MSFKLNTSRADQAAFFRKGLERGFVAIEEIVRWADQVISEESEPDPAIIEIALCGSKPKMMSEHLEKLGQGSSIHKVRGLVLKRLGEILINDPSSWREIHEHVYQLGCDYDIDVTLGNNLD